MSSQDIAFFLFTALTLFVFCTGSTLLATAANKAAHRIEVSSQGIDLSSSDRGCENASLHPSSQRSCQ